jgi:uncharacterized protein involved in outer membrane biogenesis
MWTKEKDSLSTSKWLRRALIAMALLLAMAVALPYLVPLDQYIPQIEQAASTKLRQPVSIASLRLALLPVPHVSVDGIVVGTGDDIKLGKVVVTPDLFSLLQSTKVIKSIEFDSLMLTQRALSRIPAWIKADAARSSAPAPAPQVRLESVRLDGALLKFGKESFGPFDARVDLDGSGAPGEASIVTEDGRFKAFIKPEHSNYLIDVHAKAWTLPLGPPVVFDELIVQGQATLKDANLSEVSAKLYGGTVKGKASIGWTKGLQIDGSLALDQVEMQKVAAMLSPGTHVGGKLTARPVFSASSASADQLMNALRLETPFSVQNGVIHGVDIRQAATSLIKRGTTGGETRFDELSGHLLVEHGGYSLTQLKIGSGALAVDGNVNISPSKSLSGRIDAEVKAVGASVTVPLNVAGTVDVPLLYPTGGTLAGAAVGTAVLGPGLGTSVGARAGSWAEGLFGKKDEKKPK